jgi:hypothetical protein
MRLLLAVLLASSALAQEGDPMQADAVALEPVLSKSWALGESCEAELVDYAIDTDGTLYQRAPQSFTQLAHATLDGETFTTVDEIGTMRTTSIYTLKPDGALRLMSEVSDPYFGEPAPNTPDADPIIQRVKDGMIVIDENGQSQAGVATPALTPCPRRAAYYAADIAEALEGAWAAGDGKGGICPVGADSVTFQLTRPVPHVLRGPFGGEVTSKSYALAIGKSGESYVVTEGSAFEAGDATFTPDGKGGLRETRLYSEQPVTLHRCP